MEKIKVQNVIGYETDMGIFLSPLFCMKSVSLTQETLISNLILILQKPIISVEKTMKFSTVQCKVSKSMHGGVLKLL